MLEEWVMNNIFLPAMSLLEGIYTFVDFASASW